MAKSSDSGKKDDGSVYGLKYLGKGQTASGVDELPIEGFPVPAMMPGDTQAFPPQLLALSRFGGGTDKEQVEAIAAYYNGNRGEHPLFEVVRVAADATGTGTTGQPDGLVATVEPSPEAQVMS